jgi:oligogalacturonide lyase
VCDRFSRRAFLVGSALSPALTWAYQAKRARQLPQAGEFTRFADPTTEATVVRLTAPGSNNLLPNADRHFISVKEKSLLFTSDRGGTNAPYLLDLRTGVPRMLSQPLDVDPRYLCFDPTERFACYLEGDKLQQVAIGSGKVQTLSGNVTGYGLGPQRSQILVRRTPGRLELLNGKRGPEDVGDQFAVSPDGSSCLFLRDAQGQPGSQRTTRGDSIPSIAAGSLTSPDQELWTIPASFAGKERLLFKGKIWCPFWSPDSQSILFLKQGEQNGVTTSEIHSVGLSGTGEQVISATSKYSAFAPNANATVFVGASESKAQPDILLLLRSVRRELTVCEHRGGTGIVDNRPVFSPDSRRIFFQSDRDSDGKISLYSVNVEQLVEST